MATTTAFETDFKGLPPFPNDVPQVPLKRINLAKLVNNDKDECERLWQASTSLGFFYLDLRGSHAAANGTNGTTNGTTNGHAKSDDVAALVDGEQFNRDASDLFGVIDGLFDLPMEEKQKCNFRDSGTYTGYLGYKAIGAFYADATGAKDRCESYNVSPSLSSSSSMRPKSLQKMQISKDDLLGISDPLPAPAYLKSQHKLLKSHTTNAHAIIQLLLTRLSSSLGLSESESLAQLHRLQHAGGDHASLIKTDMPPREVDNGALTMGAHTDYGLVTLLFNRLGGLQIYTPPGTRDVSGQQDGGWMYIRPLPDHCIVNLGDATVKLSAGIFRSATHRVLRPPRNQGGTTRSSLAYFSHPESDVVLRALRGKGSDLIDRVSAARDAAGEVDEAITSTDWLVRRSLPKPTREGYAIAMGTEAKDSLVP